MTNGRDALRELMLHGDQLISTQELADRTGLSYRTLNEWGKRGKYPSVLEPPGDSKPHGKRWWPQEVVTLIARDLEQDTVGTAVVNAATVEGGADAIDRAREMLRG